MFGADGTWLTTRRIDGQFPNYRQLLPEQFEHELAAAARGAARGRPPRLADGAAQLAAAAALRRGRADGVGRTQDVGEARESLPAPFAADPLEIGFNAEFLRDGLESVDADTIKFKLISPLRPAVLEGDDARLRVSDHADPSRRLIVDRVTLRRVPVVLVARPRARARGRARRRPNGVGKTNLLEALHLGTQGFSPRTRHDGQLIRFGETAARVRSSGARAAIARRGDGHASPRPGEGGAS